MPTFDEMLAELLEEPEEVLGVLSDIVNRGRMQADDLDPEVVDILAAYDMVLFLVQRRPRQPLRTWLYPSALGLRTYAVLEREAERVEASLHAEPRPRRGGTGVSR